LIHSFDPSRRTNARLMRDCGELGYLVEPVLDLTYGNGRFWSELPEIEVVKNDIDETRGDFHHDFRSFPSDDSTFGTVVFDPPYRIGGTPSTPDFDEAYGLNKVMSVGYVKGMIDDGVKEATRLASKFVLIKVQDHISSGVLQPLALWAITAGENAGAQLVDSLHVVGGRAQPKGRRQVRARHGYSTLLVLRVRVR